MLALKVRDYFSCLNPMGLLTQAVQLKKAQCPYAEGRSEEGTDFCWEKLRWCVDSLTNGHQDSPQECGLVPLAVWGSGDVPLARDWLEPLGHVNPRSFLRC